MNQSSTLPVIVAPHDSGVTQDDLNEALFALISTRIYENLTDGRAIAERVTKGLALDAIDATSIAAVLDVLEQGAADLQRVHTALTRRFEALQRAHTDSLHRTAQLTLVKAG